MENFEVALVKRACPICGKKVDSEIIMNQKLTKKAAEEVKNLHGKVIGYADKVCKDCEKYKDNLFIIEIDPEKSDMKRMETIYRTGRYLVCDKNCQLYTDAKKFIIKLKDDVEFIFMDKEIFSRIYESNKEKKKEMAQITIIKADGSMVETPPMNHNEARDLFDSLKNDGSDNVYILHFI